MTTGKSKTHRKSAVNPARLSAGLITGNALELIREIHRHDDGVVTFHTNRTGPFKNVVGIRARALAQSLSKRRTKLARDSYFSLNAFWFGDAEVDETPAYRTRKRDRLRYLCTAFSDLDCYKVGLSPTEARHRVEEFVETWVLPPVSGFGLSGRGLWVFWLLEDRDASGRAQRAFPEKIWLYDDIQAELSARLATLGADAKDAMRVARIPGSINSKSGTLVEYEFYNRPDGALIMYTLDALSEWLGMQRRLPARRKSGPTTKSVPNRRCAYLSLARRRLREIEKLRAMRGGFHEGTRNNAAMIYAWLLRCAGYHRPNAERMVFELGQECRPPLSRSECLGALETGFNQKMVKFRDVTISDKLAVTPAEAAVLEKLPPASQYGPPVTATKPKRQRMSVSDRRFRIRWMIQIVGFEPTTRQMQEQLAEYGFRTSHVSIAADYKQMGVGTPEFFERNLRELAIARRPAAGFLSATGPELS